jgi:hypothetical protein
MGKHSTSDQKLARERAKREKRAAKERKRALHRACATVHLTKEATA